MGSFNKRMKRKQQQADAEKNKQHSNLLEVKLSNQIKAKQYEKALDTLAELVESKNVSPEAMYEGALAYFMLGDYDRAATWVNNTLNFAPGHVRARLLLARICIQQDRKDDAYAVIDFILDKGKGSLRDDEMDEIKNILGVCSKGDRDRIRKSFPNVAEVLDQVAVETGNTGISEDASQLLSKLKAKIADKKETVRDAAEHKASATELLQALKEKVNAINTKKDAKTYDEIIEAKADEIAEEISEEIAENLSTKITNAIFGDDSKKKDSEEQVLDVEPLEEETVEETDTEESEADDAEAADVRETEAEVPNETEDDSSDAAAVLDEILSQKIPAMEKVRVLNAYAGDYYVKDQLENAKLLLEAALELDIDDNTLRNLAVLYHDLGDKEKALEMASKMHHTYFALLRVLKND